MQGTEINLYLAQTQLLLKLTQSQSSEALLVLLPLF